MNNLPTPKKSLGQHWLMDEQTLKAIADSADLNPDDTVLEIGPGMGTLTKFLVEQAGEVVAVEYDASLASKLPGSVKSANLTVINQDILNFDLTSLPPDYKVVANIPYYLTSNLIRVLSESANPPVKVVLLIQKEVAERVVAKPGAMSLLSVSAQFYWETLLGDEVPAKLFTPPPKVDSQILILTRRQEPLFPRTVLGNEQEKDFFRIIKAGFANRRKTLLNSLSGGLQRDKIEIAEILKAANLNPSSRPQELSLDDWFSVYKQLS
jgi:16S rRNA (adenine1518-N6/adenine1519-N6)-dimethyltransferase